VFSFFRNRRRRQLLAAPFPERWREIIERNVAVYPRLTRSQQKRLEDATRLLIDERPIVGCRGLVVTDEVKVTIAAQAALLLLGEEGYYFDRVPSILVYPQAYSHRHSLGSAHPVEEDVAMLGESWQRGSIILSWPAVLSGGRDPSDGQNLVLHEFAHHLDGLDGEMGGLPPLPTPGAEQHWVEVFGREFERHANDVAAERETLLDPYGATNKAEMFAVATECFFEQPHEMRSRHPNLYECFLGFYKVDPADWFDGVPAGSRGPRYANDGGRDDFVQEWHDAESPAQPQPELATADQYFTRGYDHLLTGQFELAEADLDRAVKLDPRDQEALGYRAEARFLLGHLEAALADAERACALDAADPQAKRIRGMARVALQQYASGLADLEQTVDAAGNDADGLFWRGVANARLGSLPAAIRDFTRVIEIDPDDAEAFYERGCCFENLGQTATANQDLTRAQQLGHAETG
jgi:MtfA peptidase